MRRSLLATAAALTLLAVAGPATAGGPALEDDDRHLCVLLDTEKNQGYCVKTHGLPTPTVPVPKLPDLPDSP